MKTKLPVHVSRFTFPAAQFAVAATFLAFALRGSAAVQTFSWTGSQVVPDNNASGLAFTFNVPGSPLMITDVSVNLNIAGGWNGDLYAYLSHGSGFVVLLNRI